MTESFHVAGEGVYRRDEAFLLAVTNDVVLDHEDIELISEHLLDDAGLALEILGRGLLADLVDVHGMTGFPFSSTSANPREDVSFAASTGGLAGFNPLLSSQHPKNSSEDLRSSWMEFSIAS